MTKTKVALFIILGLAILVVLVALSPDDFERIEQRMPQLAPQKVYADILTPQIYLPAVFKFQMLEITNPGFEAGQWQETAWCEEPCTVLRYDQFNEVRPPVGWTAFWRDGYGASRPEVTITTDPARVHSGEQALKWFTFWRIHFGGVAQRLLDDGITLYIRSSTNYPLKHEDLYVDDVSAFFNPDGSVVVDLWIHGWYSDCDYRPYDPPYSKDCYDSLDDALQFFKVCVDFDGGPVDPRNFGDGGPTVQCSGWVEQYGRYTVEPLRFVVPCDDC